MRRLGRDGGLGRGGAGGVDLANPGELLDERQPRRVAHLDAAEDDGVVAQVNLRVEHRGVEAGGNEADSREDDARSHEPARHGEVDLLHTVHVDAPSYAAKRAAASFFSLLLLQKGETAFLAQSAERRAICLETAQAPAPTKSAPPRKASPMPAEARAYGK